MPWSKNGGIPVKNLPPHDFDAAGNRWDDLRNSEEARQACGWAPAGAPAVVSRMQLRVTLAGMASAVEGKSLLRTIDEFVATKPETVQEYWNNTSEFHRDHALITQFGTELGMSPDQIDAIYIAAKGVT